MNADQALAAALELHRAGRLAEAETSYRQILAIDPNHLNSLHLLGLLCTSTARPAEAIELISRAAALAPAFPELQMSLGNALCQVDRFEEAIDRFRQAVTLRPDFADAWVNLGNTLADVARFDNALAAYDRAIAIRPDYPEAHRNRGFVLLQLGDFSRGWAEHEWRWRCTDRVSPLRDFQRPRWNGEPLAGKTVLMDAEQGSGDTIQFVRYASFIRERGGRAVVGCPPELLRLVKSHPDVQAAGSAAPLPPFDLHLPMMSFPLVAQTRLETIPRRVPYLFAEPADVAAWQSRLAGSPGLKVGLVWAGSPGHRDDRRRSMALASLAPLWRAPGVTFFSLQKGPAAAEIAAHPSLPMIDFTADLRDFADTAALVTNLDLVISVDTAVAHLAGALAKPIWMLLPFKLDWRWLTVRHDSPWYPTARLFRQPGIGQWEPVVRAALEALAKRATDRARSS